MKDHLNNELMDIVRCPCCGNIGRWEPGTILDGWPALCPECKPNEDEFISDYVNHAAFGV